MRLALSFGGYYTSVANYVKAARFCEAHSISSIWLPDSQMIHRDVYQCLALCATNTKKIGLATGVTNPVTRDITITANSISTLNEISSGRAILGIGVGDSSVRRIGAIPSSVAKLECAVKDLITLCKGEPKSFPQGMTERMRWVSGRVPIFVSATGKRMLKVAARIADGVIINVGTAEQGVKDAIELVRAEVFKRPREEIDRFRISNLSFINVAENRKEAIKAARPYVIWYWDNARRLFEINGVPSEALERNLRASKSSFAEQDHIHSDNWSSSLSLSSFITDEMIEKFTIAGTPEDCVKRLREIERSGVQLFIARHTGDEKEWNFFLKEYCENILPEFQ
jgi:5,10-methylenetetrahydromethanopterin reductase